MTGYVRKDTTNNIADGNVINAADLDSEFDGVQDAFNASTGHKHDGTAGEGATINALGPTQDVTISATLVAPKTTNTIDIGSSALKFKDLFLAGNSSIGGTLAVTGVATLTAQPILSSLTASSAVATDASKGLVSVTNTGTGNNVLATSPTLVTPVLGTPSSGTLTNATGLPLTTGVTGTLPVANGGTNLTSFTSGGVVYASSTSALATGSALTFDGTNLGVGTAASYKLHVSGTGAVTSRTYATDATGDASFFVGNNNGRLAGPLVYGSTKTAYGALGSDETAFYSNGSITIMADDASKVIKFAAGGNTEGMRLTSTSLYTASGINVGIGLSNPPQLLSLYKATGSVKMNLDRATNTQENSIVLNLAGANQWQFGTGVSAAGSDFEFYDYSGTAGTRLIIKQGGNVGIGTSSPAAKLDVGGANVTFDTNAIGQALIRSTTAYNATPRAGIGFIVKYTSGGTQTAGGCTIQSYKENATDGDFATGLLFTTQANGAAPAERMRLDSSGNLGVGDTSPPAPGGADARVISLKATKYPQFIYKATDAAADSTTWRAIARDTLQFQIQTVNDAINTEQTAYEIIRTTGSNSINYQRWYTATSEKMRLDNSGNLLVGTTSATSGGKIVSNGIVYQLQTANGTSGTPVLSGGYLIGPDDPAIYAGIRALNAYLSSNASQLAFYVTNTTGGAYEAGRFTEAGNLFLGGITQYNSAKFTISYSGAANNGLAFIDTVDQASTEYLSFHNAAGTKIGGVNRVSTTNAVVYNTTSDYRLKTVTGAVTGQGSRIDALKPIDYLWTEGGQQARGFLAHEFQTIYPNSVTGDKDAIDAKGKPKHQSMQAGSSEVIADLVAEIQSLRKRLAAAGI